MIDFAQLIKNAYRITVNHPRLWFFGLFLVGGFNLGFLNFQNFDWHIRKSSSSIPDVLSLLQTEPSLVLIGSIVLLVVALAGFVITNWAKILLTLDIHARFPQLQFQFGTKEVKQGVPSFKQLLLSSRKYVLPVVWVSFLTTFLLAGVSILLLLPSLYLFVGSNFQGLFLALAAAIILVLTFVISCLNIFAIFFVILLDKRPIAALNLATDFVVHKWREMLGLAVILVLAYSLCFFAGVSVIYSIRFLVELLRGVDVEFGVLGGSAIIIMSRIISGLIIWGLLAILNVFFNACLLLLFSQLVKPWQSSEEVKTIQPAPVHSHQ